MSERFFSSQPIDSDEAKLDGQEAHHLLHVMRCKVGDRVKLFDGSGTEYAAEIIKCGRSTVELRILGREEVDRELPFELVVGVALPKGDRQKLLVEKLTELGATVLVPLVTEHAVAQPNDSARARLERTVVEASKQCGRNRLMRIKAPQTWNEWIGSIDEGRLLVAHPGGRPVAEVADGEPERTKLAIGPEGGFTDEEIAAATAASWQVVGLGKRVLRVETAAMALVAALGAGH